MRSLRKPENAARCFGLLLAMAPSQSHALALPWSVATMRLVNGTGVWVHHFEPPISFCEAGTFFPLLGARTLLEAPGLTTRRTLLGAPGIATRSIPPPPCGGPATLATLAMTNATARPRLRPYSKHLEAVYNVPSPCSGQLLGVWCGKEEVSLRWKGILMHII